MPIVAVFVTSGLCASLAGALLAFSQASATPGFNSTLLLQSVSAAILGGVALTGGKGSIRGAAFGAIVLATLNSGLSLVSASGVAINLANGGLLLAIVLLDARAPYLERRIAAGRARIGGPSPLPQS
jgi:ribose/xylose/arabinose/galactoside ABC-type transport system permease subunit